MKILGWEIKTKKEISTKEIILSISLLLLWLIIGEKVLTILTKMVGC